MVTIDDKEVKENLDKFLNEQLADLLSGRMEKACIMVEGVAKEKAPVDDGQLRQSITFEVDEKGNEIVGYVGSNVEYAPYVHQGTGVYAINGDGRKEVPWTYKAADGKFYKTVGQKPNPFLKMAIQECKNKIAKIFENLI